MCKSFDQHMQKCISQTFNRPSPFYDKAKSDMKNFTDIIVGGGTAGCLLANRLSQDKHRRVALVEAGRADLSYGDLWMKVPVGYLKSIGNPACDYMFRTTEQKALDGRRLRYPRGRILGGCSAINGMIYMRGQSRDYDSWASRTQEASWKWNNVLPLFRKHEDYTISPEEKQSGAATGEKVEKEEDEIHGRGGEWTVSQQRLSWPILDAVHQAAVNLGMPDRFDFNGGNNFGVGYFDVNQRRGKRLTTAEAFLPASLQKARPNLVIFGLAMASSIEFDALSGKATKVMMANPASGESDYSIELDPSCSSANIILAAGAIATPCILERSGIGRKDVLDEHHVKVKIESNGVGCNLQDHLQIRTHAETTSRTRTLNTMSHSRFWRMMMGLEYLLLQSGPLSMAPSQLGIFAKSDASMAFADVEFHVQPLSLDAFGQPLHRYPAITLSACNLNPTSRGTVHIASADPRDHPVIDPNYLSTPADQEHALKCIQLARQLYSEPSLAQHIVCERAPGADMQTREQLLQAIGEIATTIFHPVGTCAMGVEGDPNSVVNGNLRLHELRNVYVADASVMPTITSGNTNAPVLMIAEKLAQQLLAGNKN